ncbi:MAG: prolipoprotein diacylglyceryl transferase [Defluviitaleaceae bacterium]|nr:prolipoprotein diacylglyceryl transferase [Defluviitaleaceae bacterium]
MLNTNFPFYGIAIILSLIVNVIVVIFCAKKYNFTRDELIGALIYENVGIIMGAMVLSYLQSPYVHEGFDLTRVGLTAYGGVIGAIVCLVIFGLQFKKTIGQMLFTFMPSIPIMYAIGKIGCFFAGCCHGIEYNGFGSVVYNYSLAAPANISLFPVQIVETVVFTGIFIYMINRAIKNKFDFKTLGFSFILCGFAKFALDFLRMSHTGQISLNQIISIAFIIIGVWLFFIVNREKSILQAVDK